MVKVDSYVLESNVHFPTDLNLLWDGCCKCIELLEQLCEALELKGWRKSKAWKKKLKSLMRSCSQISRSGGADKVARFQAKVKEYLRSVYDLESKVHESLEELKNLAFCATQLLKLTELHYYHEMLVKHIDLIERRVLKNEKIPHEEKVFSLFEPHTEWINKGKRQIELGHRILISSDQYGLILDYKVMDHSVDVQETIPLADRLIHRFGEDQIAGLSVDKGFSDKEDRELLELFITEVTMPKKGKRNKADKERESQKRFKLLRNKHSAIESVINSLEHHGLDRCPDKGFNGFKRYVGFGVLAYNLHKIGKYILYQKQRFLKAA